MSVSTRSAGESAVRRPPRSELRTCVKRRPPRQHWLFALPRLSSWPLTTRPPRSGRSGSQRPVETGFIVFLEAGRTAMPLGRTKVVCC